MTKLNRYSNLIKILKYKFFFLILGLLFLPACFEPTYKDNEIVESVKNIVSKEFEIRDIKAERIKNALWIYIPVEQIIDENELDKKTLEKIGKVSRAGSRVIFSSDRKVKFIVMIAYDKIGIELKMVRHIEDVKRVQAWYIAYSDFYKRMDIGMGFNPEVMGRKAIKDIYLNKEEISKFFLSKINKNKINSISKSGNISELHSLRINENQALIYVETMEPNFRSLFLIDVESFDILKELLMLYLTMGKEELNLPLIADYWNLSEEDWPGEYEDYQNAGDWEGRVYAREINFEKFIARQIKRRIEKRFEEKYDEWNVKFKELNVTFLRDEILVSREIYPLNKPVYDIEIDYEISIIITNTINNYQLNEVKSLVIGGPGWGERTVTSRRELLKLKPKKWKSIEKVKKDKEMSIKDVLLWMFLPQYDTQWDDIVQLDDSDE